MQQAIHGTELLDPRQISWLEDQPLSAVRDYLLYMHIPSISGGLLFHTKSEDTRLRSDKEPLNLRLAK